MYTVSRPASKLVLISIFLSSFIITVSVILSEAKELFGFFALLRMTK